MLTLVMQSIEPSEKRPASVDLNKKVGRQSSNVRSSTSPNARKILGREREAKSTTECFNTVPYRPSVLAHSALLVQARDLAVISGPEIEEKL